jgi:hypothetical protein
MHTFYTEELGIEDRCGGCNNTATVVYWMSTSREQAKQEILAMQEGENPLCGDCMCDLLTEGKYAIGVVA